MSLLFGLEDVQRLGVDADVGFLEGVKPGARGNQMAEDDILLQSHQAVDLAGQRRFGQYLGRFLEAGGGDEAGALHGRLGDSQQLCAGGGRFRLGALGQITAERFDLRIHLLDGLQRNDRIDFEVAVTLVRDLQALGQSDIRFAELELVHHDTRQEIRIARILDH